ncbi:CLUMA_CG001782, isoform A [Clunio marinus]|uniref:CLUMA_CG001782, isoform A n=1 Tax=Clunio marinus TaxID=568069 RepID=A0A1J1HKQ8_9DIPT|nr:CLUMA_CG001782, isoform A [Clunio marinus]
MIPIDNFFHDLVCQIITKNKQKLNVGVNKSKEFKESDDFLNRKYLGFYGLTPKKIRFYGLLKSFFKISNQSNDLTIIGNGSFFSISFLPTHFSFDVSSVYARI